MKTNVDILLYDETSISISLPRVLGKYTDISFFTKKDMSVVVPDIVVFTKEDIYAALKDIREAGEFFKDSKFVYIASSLDSPKLATIFLFGSCHILTADLSQNALYKSFKAIGLYTKGQFTDKYRTKFLHLRYGYMFQNGLTPKEMCILCAKLRGYSTKELSKIFHIGCKNIDILCNSAYKALALPPTKRRSIENILKYGGIIYEGSYKRYSIPKSRRYGCSYFIIPKISEN